MIIDCDSCTAGPRACTDCVVGHLLARPAPPAADRGRHPVETDEDGVLPPAELDAAELAAVSALAAGGLLPPLRLVTVDKPQVATRGDVPEGDPVRFGAGLRAG